MRDTDLSVFCPIQFQFEIGEQLFRNFPVKLVVFRQQDMFPLKLQIGSFFVLFSRIHLLLFGLLEIKCDMEFSTFVQFAADGDRTAHRVYDIFSDCHSKPGTFCFLYLRIVFPAEGIE